jgi:hypothetical protein
MTRYHPFILIAAALILAIDVHFAFDIPLVIERAGTATAKTPQRGNRPDVASPLVREALASEFFRPQAPFKGVFANPFGLKGHPLSSPVAGNTPPSPITVPGKILKIKGLLLKANPIAVLEDESGSTHICAVGDTVGPFKIIRIQADKVTVAHGRHTYDITASD